MRQTVPASVEKGLRDQYRMEEQEDDERSCKEFIDWRQMGTLGKRKGS